MCWAACKAATWLATAVLMCTCSQATACIFARGASRSYKLPDPQSWSRELQQAAGIPADRISDATDSYMDSGSILTGKGAKFQKIVDLSKSLMQPTDLCYWGIHSLYSPQLPANFTLEEAQMVYQLSTQALAGMQALVNDTIMWAGATFGYYVLDRLCKANIIADPAACTPANLNKDGLLFPAASFIIKFKANATNKEQIVDTMTKWRNKANGGHAPAMNSSLVAQGWGNGSQLLAKVARCSDIPAQFQYTRGNGMDAAGAARPLFDEALEAWSGLCNLFSDPTYASKQGSCREAALAALGPLKAPPPDAEQDSRPRLSPPDAAPAPAPARSSAGRAQHVQGLMMMMMMPVVAALAALLLLV